MTIRNILAGKRNATVNFDCLLRTFVMQIKKLNDQINQNSFGYNKVATFIKQLNEFKAFLHEPEAAGGQ